MMKILVLGNGFISDENMRKLSKQRFHKIICCGTSISLCDRFNADEIIVLLAEARLQPMDFWKKVDKVRKESQMYNRVASDIDIDRADRILLAHTKSIFANRSIMINAFNAKFGQVKNIEILDNRMLILQWIRISNKIKMLRDTNFADLLSVILMLIMNCNVKRLNYDWVSSGIKGIIYASMFKSNISTAGISFSTREYGFVEGVRYKYPKKGKTAHLKNDIKFIKHMKNKISIY